MVDLESFKEKLSEKYRLSGELDKAQLNDNLFYFFYVIDNVLDTNLINLLGNRKKSIAIGSGKGGTGKTTKASNIAYLLAKKGKETILGDSDYGGPNQFRRMKGLVNFDFEKLEEGKKALKGKELIKYFRENAPISNNAKEILINWYENGLLKKLNLPHFLMYRDTIGRPFYEKQLKLEDLLINAGDNLQIIFGLLETDSYPLTKTPDKTIKDFVSSVLSLPADRIVFDTPPGLNHGSLYTFNIADIRYVLASIKDMSSTEEPMDFVKGAIAYRFQMKSEEWPLLKEKKKEIDDNYNQQLKIFQEELNRISEKLKINTLQWVDHIKRKFIESSSYQMDDDSFELIKAVIAYGKPLYEKEQFKEYNLEDGIIKELQEEASKLSEFQDLTKTGLSLFDFIEKNGDNPLIKKELDYISGTTFFVINDVAHDAGEQAEEILKKIVYKSFESKYKVTLSLVEGAHYLYSLEDSVSRKAIRKLVPFAHHLSQLKDERKKFDSDRTEDYYNQLNKLIEPVI